MDLVGGFEFFERLDLQGSLHLLFCSSGFLFVFLGSLGAFICGELGYFEHVYYCA